MERLVRDRESPKGLLGLYGIRACFFPPREPDAGRGGKNTPGRGTTTEGHLPRVASTDRPHPLYQLPEEAYDKSSATPPIKWDSDTSATLSLVRDATVTFNAQKQTVEPGQTAPVGGTIDPSTWELTPIEESFRHGFWASRRRRVYAALKASGVSIRRLINFANCGAGAWVFQDRKTGAIRVESSHCHDRFCQACGAARASQLQAALAERVPQRKTLHVVLTLKSSDAPLGEQLDRLYKSAGKLRQSKLWKSRVTGGMASLELTRSAATGQWHPHLHCLIHCDWMPQDQLSAEWLKTTGDSSIVHVSLVSNEASAIREVTKYVTKPVHRSIDFQPESLELLIRALHKRHLVCTFGTWRSDPLIKREKRTDDTEWKRLCSLSTLHQWAAQGQIWARAALMHLASLKTGRVPMPLPQRPAPS